MEVECPECRGAHTMRYIIRKPMPRTPALCTEPMAEAVYAATTEPCRTCKGSGYVTSTERVPVTQGGRRIGTVPHDFNPRRIKSTNWLYDPREGDFRLQDGAWIAARTLGPGDIEAVPGFVWDRA